MKTYKLISQPYPIGLTTMHTLKDEISGKFIKLTPGAVMYCCKVEGTDHKNGKSLMLFSANIISTFVDGSDVLKDKWIISDYSPAWKDVLRGNLADKGDKVEITNFK